MCVVPARSEERQAAAVEFKARQLLVTRRTGLVNALRGHLAEFGSVAAKGLGTVADLVAVVRDPEDSRLPAIAREALQDLANQIEAVADRIVKLERGVVRRSNSSETARRLCTIPGIGPRHRLQATARLPRALRVPWCRTQPVSGPPVTSPPGSA